jgi:hypothetical protein
MQTAGGWGWQLRVEGVAIIRASNWSAGFYCSIANYPEFSGTKRQLTMGAEAAPKSPLFPLAAMQLWHTSFLDFRCRGRFANHSCGKQQLRESNLPKAYMGSAIRGWNGQGVHVHSRGRRNVLFERGTWREGLARAFVDPCLLHFNNHFVSPSNEKRGMRKTALWFGHFSFCC